MLLVSGVYYKLYNVLQEKKELPLVRQPHIYYSEPLSKNKVSDFMQRFWRQF